MKQLFKSFLLAAALAGSAIAGQTDAPLDPELDAKRLRSLLPKILKSSDRRLVHEAPVIIRDDQFRNRQPSDTLRSQVIATLERLLKDPKASEAVTRRVACEVLGQTKSQEAIAVLLKALPDPHVDWDFFPDPGGAAEVNWFAVWRDADKALREITQGQSSFTAWRP